MSFFVKDLVGKTITFDLNILETIDKLKAKLADREGIPVVHQRLLFDGKQLEDQYTLLYMVLKVGIQFI
jgi:ubiquitin-like protein Nedd8